MSPRGGKRPGAGRPKTKGEKRTASLAGVRVTPSELRRYRKAAMSARMSLSAWVVEMLVREIGEFTCPVCSEKHDNQHGERTAGGPGDYRVCGREFCEGRWGEALSYFHDNAK